MTRSACVFLCVVLVACGSRSPLDEPEPNGNSSGGAPGASGSSARPGGNAGRPLTRNEGGFGATTNGNGSKAQSGGVQGSGDGVQGSGDGVQGSGGTRASGGASTDAGAGLTAGTRGVTSDAAAQTDASTDPCQPNPCGRPAASTGMLCELPRFEAIEPLAPDPPGGELQATAISRDGNVVVGFHGGGTHDEAFRWSSGTGLVELGALQTTDTNVQAHATNRDGSVIVGISQTFAVGAPIRAFRWTAQSGMEGLGLPTASALVDALGVSADGSVVVGSWSDEQTSPVAFRWTRATGRVSIGAGYAIAPSADGSVIVGFITGQGSFRWTIALGETLMTPSPPYRTARATNGDGSIIVGQSDSYHAFRWSEQTGFAALDEPQGAASSGATGVSEDGSVIVGTSSGSETWATVWDGAGTPRFVRDVAREAGIDVTGWTFQNAVGVSADGKVIAGNGISPRKVYEAWIVRIP